MNLSPEKRIAGILLPLFALRGEDDLGIGDLGALRELIDWAAEIGFKVIQLLPINETGIDNSPYNAISAMAIELTTAGESICEFHWRRRQRTTGRLSEILRRRGRVAC